MLIDQVKVQFIAGRGGNGAAKYDSAGRPRGGDGGEGGDIYMEGSRSLYDLRIFKNAMKYKAENGDHGNRERMKGKKGDDLVLKVPLTTLVYDENKNLIATIEKEGEKVLVAKGGIGGKGNFHFRNQEYGLKNEVTLGREGENFEAVLELQLPADVLFIGFPNAGKSSMLNALTNANVKVASYPFTTIQPQLGTMERVVLMDFPGLIENTAGGKGLGTRFVRHMLAPTLIAHFISLESDDILRDYNLMRKELEEIHEDLATKDEVIILTKADMFEKDYIEKKVGELKQIGKEVIVTSTFAGTRVEEVREKFKKAISTKL
jgi:GTP-binding protein